MKLLSGRHPAEAAPASSPRDVVFTFNYITWDIAVRRGMHFAQDRLAGALLHDPRVGRLVIANPFRSYASRLVAPLRSRREHFPAGSNAVLHAPLRLRRSDPVGLQGVEDCFRAYDRSLELAARRAGLRNPAVITTHPLVAGFAPLEWAGRVTFYATDDWTAHPGYKRWRSAYEESYVRVRSRGHSLCAVSAPIVERVAPTGLAEVVPNGVEPDEWLTPASAPAWFEELPHPRLLYVGSLDSRLDIEAIRQTALAFPEGSVTLVGTLADPRRLAPLRELHNVQVRAALDRRTVVGLVTSSDACLLPHVATPLTTAMSPLKAYEYVAGGKPVAAMRLPPLHDIHPRLLLADHSRDFVGVVRAALALPSMTEVERRAFIDANSWHRRHERLLGLALS